MIVSPYLDEDYNLWLFWKFVKPLKSSHGFLFNLWYPFSPLTVSSLFSLSPFFCPFNRSVLSRLPLNLRCDFPRAAVSCTSYMHLRTVNYLLGWVSAFCRHFDKPWRQCLWLGFTFPCYIFSSVTLFHFFQRFICSHHFFSQFLFYFRFSISFCFFTEL